MNWITIAIMFSILTRVCYSENETFVATVEWKEIKPGQVIPAGLHVRINLETGKKEAKLLVEYEDQQKSSTDLSAVPEDDSTGKTSPFKSKKKLKISKKLSDALKNMPNDQLGIEHSPEILDNIKKSYKSYDEIKHSLKDMKLNFKSDAEIISELIKEYKNVTKEASKHADVIMILDNFNYLVHQIDNAIWFIDEGGLDVVLLPTIANSTNTDMRVRCMRVLGALTQNNPMAQLKVFEKNFGSLLSQVLISSASTSELSTALYAFGSLLRKFPNAQKNILSRSGTRALIMVLSKDCELKIKAKALTVISDLIVEKDFALANRDHLEWWQYFELNFEEWLLANEFCETVNAALLLEIYELIEQPDIAEYLVQSLIVTVPICRKVWSNSLELTHALLTLRNRYIHTNEEYRLEVAKLIEKLIALLTTTNGVKDEL